WSGGVGVAAAGSCYASGTFNGQVELSGISITANGQNAFVIKYDSGGVPPWVRQGGGMYTGASAPSPCKDGLYVGGWFRGAATFGNVQLPDPGNDAFFVAAYDQGGQLKWIRCGSNHVGDTWVRAVANANEGGVYAVGSFFDHLTLGSYPGPLVLVS